MASPISNVQFIRGPRPMPVVGRRGNILQFSRDPLHYLRAAYGTFGPVCALTDGDSRFVFAVGPEYNHLLLSRPEEWRTALSLARLPGITPYGGIPDVPLPDLQPEEPPLLYAPLIDATQAMVDRWGRGQLVNVDFVMRRLMRRFALVSLCGITAPDDAPDVRDALRQWIGAVTRLPVVVSPLNIPGTAYHQLLKQTEQLERVLAALIQRKRAANVGRYDLFARLIHEHATHPPHVDDSVLAREVMAWFIAGYETAASALTWTLFLLSQHLAVLNDVRDELHGVLRGAAPTLAQLERLPLLERVIKESLRLLPPISIGRATSLAPVTLGQYEIPPGTTVLYSPHMTQRLPASYIAPDRFRPHRWIHIEPEPHEYLPFGADSRARSALPQTILHVKLVLAILLQRYHLALAPGVQIDRSFKLTLMPKAGMPMIIMPPDRRVVLREVRGNIREMLLFG